MSDQKNPYSIPDQQPKKSKLDPALLKMAAEDPVGYKNHMVSAGRESELEPEDHIRAATAGLWSKITGGGQ